DTMQRSVREPNPQPLAGVGPGLLVAVLLALVARLIGSAANLISPLIIAVALGILAGNTVEIASARAGMRLAASRLLRIGVVLIGLRVALDDLAAIGLPGLVVVMMVLSVTFLCTQWIGRRMGISADLSLLIGTGYSICGVSAVAAMNGVIRGDEEEAAYAIGLVTLAGSLSIVVLPLLGAVVGMTPGDFGTWVGGAVHDVAQTVATASTNGDEALTAAIVVKLTRVALLAPLVVGVALARRRNTSVENASRPPLLPLFVAGFLLMVGVRSTGIIPDSWLDPIRQVESFLFTVSLVGVGFGVDLGRLRRLGGRPLALGMAAWVLVAGMSYLGVLITR
ncbi:MAG TPA: putative sulfate exporter family transporter, partial [Acidimicrobiia bacterium]|nr:putative sulfate exporter family transporter [Acidimicrobiia bacterium]